MGNAGMNALDLAVVGGMALSGYLAYKRGLVKEVLSLGSWVLAGVITVTCYPLMKPLMAQHIKSEAAVDAASAIALFCLTIIALVPIGNYLTGLVKGPNMTSIDKALGFVFGVVRGFLILSLVYLCAEVLWPEDSDRQVQPVWLETAKTRPLLSTGADFLKEAISFGKSEEVQDKISQGRSKAEEVLDDAKHLEKISTPAPAGHGTSSSPDYDQDKLKDLIDRKVTP